MSGLRTVTALPWARCNRWLKVVFCFLMSSFLPTRNSQTETVMCFVWVPNQHASTTPGFGEPWATYIWTVSSELYTDLPFWLLVWNLTHPDLTNDLMWDISYDNNVAFCVAKMTFVFPPLPPPDRVWKIQLMHQYEALPLCYKTNNIQLVNNWSLTRNHAITENCKLAQIFSV